MRNGSFISKIIFHDVNFWFHICSFIYVIPDVNDLFHKIYEQIQLV